MKILVLVCAVIAAACGPSGPADVAPAAAEIAVYDGPDRLQRLIDGAKREGELTIYTSAQSTDLGPVISAFEKKYGVKANLWRAGSEAVLNRALQEANARRDTVLTTLAALEQVLRRAGVGVPSGGGVDAALDSYRASS